MGVVQLEIGVILRNFDKYGIECWLFNCTSEWRILYLNINFAAVILDKFTFCSCVYAQIETQSQEVSLKQIYVCTNKVT
jgi:hypothetical protein